MPTGHGVKKLVTNGTTDSRDRRFYLREWREHRALTQTALAASIGTTPSRISEVESGKERYNETLLERLADALNCTPAELLAGPPGTGTDFPVDIWAQVPESMRPQAREILRTFAKPHPIGAVDSPNGPPPRRGSRKRA